MILFWLIIKMNIYLQPLWRGTLAQLVEQRTENPCVPGSIPGGTTILKPNFLNIRLLGFLLPCIHLKCTHICTHNFKTSHFFTH